jgi:repressor LexA
MADTQQPTGTPTGGRKRGRPKGSLSAKGTHDDPQGREKLSDRQRRILEVIKDAIRFSGYPPSIREICDAVGLNSTSSVSYHLKELERKGYLRREDNKPRAVDIRSFDGSPEDISSAPRPGRKPMSAAAVDDSMPAPAYVPVVGQIAAGAPILAEEHVEAHFPLPQELVGGGELFLLQVVGNSMQDAGIYNGDWVVVRSQNTAELAVRADPRRRRRNPRPGRRRAPQDLGALPGDVLAPGRDHRVDAGDDPGPDREPDPDPGFEPDARVTNRQVNACGTNRRVDFPAPGQHLGS